MADLASATAARQTAVGRNILGNKTRAWNRYSEYCQSIGLGDNLFLEDMSQTHRIEIIGAFTMAVRQGRFFRPHDSPLAESTVSDTLNHVAAVFRENGHDYPKRDAERNVAQLLRRQLRSYKILEPFLKVEPQKALTSHISEGVQGFPTCPLVMMVQYLTTYSIICSNSPLRHHSGLASIQATTMNFTFPNDLV